MMGEHTAAIAAHTGMDKGLSIVLHGLICSPSYVCRQTRASTQPQQSSAIASLLLQLQLHSQLKLHKTHTAPNPFASLHTMSGRKPNSDGKKGGGAGRGNASSQSADSHEAKSASTPLSSPPPSSSSSSSSSSTRLPSASSQYRSALHAATSTPTIRPPPPPPPKRERFADLKWSLSRELNPPAASQLHGFGGSKEQIAARVLASPRVQEAIERIAADTHNGGSGSSSSASGASREEAMQMTRQIFDGMYSTINETNIRMAIYAMRKVWRSMYEGIRVNEDGIQMLHEFAAAGTPVVLLPMHKSHIDYLLLTYVCAAYSKYPPFIIAGDNLNIPLVGRVLRHGGGLFIRRTFGDDVLYKAVFFEYLSFLLSSGYSLEVFIEGTRSRQGKLKTPRTGVLTVLADILASGTLGSKDIMLVPIAISYDKVIEGSTFVNEMLGARKQKETLTATINSINHVVRLNFGSIDISICPALSMREHLGLTSIPHSLSPHPPPPSSSSHSSSGSRLFLQASSAEQKRLITSLAHKILYQMNLRLVVSPTAIVATVLLTHLHRGISRKELIARVDAVRCMIIERGGNVAHLFEVESVPSIVDRTLKVLSKLISDQHGIVFGYRQITSLELSIYRNQLIHFFVAESIMCVAMAAEFQSERHIRNHARSNANNANNGDSASSAAASSTTVMVDKFKLLESVRFVSKLLKAEFIFKPTPDLQENVEEALEALCTRGVLRVVDEHVDGEAGKKDGQASAQPAAAGSLASRTRYVCLHPSGVDTFLFLCMLIWPFVEVYFVSIASLFVLLPDQVMEQTRLADIASRRAEALFYSGGIDFYESMNKDSIINAFEWCVKQGVLRAHQVGGIKMLQLTPEYQHQPEDLAFVSSLTSSSTSSSSSAPSSTTAPASRFIPLIPHSDRKSLRSFVLRVAHFRKIRLLSSDENRSLLQIFVSDLAATGEHSTATAATGTSTIAGLAGMVSGMTTSTTATSTSTMPQGITKLLSRL